MSDSSVVFGTQLGNAGGGGGAGGEGGGGAKRAAMNTDGFCRVCIPVKAAFWYKGELGIDGTYGT